jgi:uncharacterized protein (DUF2345 family)
MAKYKVYPKNSVGGASRKSAATKTGTNYSDGDDKGFFNHLDLLGNIKLKNGGDFSVESGGDMNVESGGNMNIQSGGNMNIESGGDLNLESGGALNLVGASIDMTSGSTIDIDATSSLTLTGGSIAIESAGSLDLTASDITIDADSSIDVTGGSIALTSDSTLDLTGSDINLNSSGNVNVESGGQIIVKSGGSFIQQTGGIYTVETGAQQTFESDTSISFQADSMITLDAGAGITMNGASLELDTDGLIKLSGGSIFVDGGDITIGQPHVDQSTTRTITDYTDSNIPGYNYVKVTCDTTGWIKDHPITIVDANNPTYAGVHAKPRNMTATYFLIVATWAGDNAPRGTVYQNEISASSGDISVNSTGTLKVDGGAIDIKADSSIDIEAGTTMDIAADDGLTITTGIINIGDGVDGFIIDADNMTITSKDGNIELDAVNETIHVGGADGFGILIDGKNN